MKKIPLILSLILLAGLISCQKGPVEPKFTPENKITSTPMTFAPNTAKVAAVLSGRINTFAISPDQKMIAFGTSKGVEVYDLTTYEKRSMVSEGLMVSSLDWSPDGKYLAVGTITGTDTQGQAHLEIWDASTWQKTGFQIKEEDFVNERILDLAWSPDGTKLAAGTDVHGVVIWDVTSDQVVSNQLEFSSSVKDVDWSPDGKRLVATGDMAYGIRRWLWENEDAVRLYDKRLGGSMVLAWSPDGNRMASGDSLGNVCFWTTATNKCDGLIQAHRSAVFSLAWSSDGTELATGAGVVRIWDTRNGTLIKAFGEYNDMRYDRIEWPSMGFPLVTLQENMDDASITVVRFWNVADGTISAEFQGGQE